MLRFPGINVNELVGKDQGMCGLKIVRICRAWAQPAPFVSLQALFSFGSGWDKVHPVQSTILQKYNI